MFGVRCSAFDVVQSRWWFYALSLVLFQLALFAKTAVSFLPVSLLLVTGWRRERLRWRDVWPLIPMLGMAGTMGWLTFHIERLYGASGGEFNIGFLERTLISGRSFWFYIGKLFYPQPLLFVYERWAIDVRPGWQYVYPLALIGLLGGLWWGRRRLGKGPFAALMHFYVSTSFLILLLALYRTRYSFVSDHWQYFGCPAILALVAAGLLTGLDRAEEFMKVRVTGGVTSAPIRFVCIGILLATLGVLTWRQCGMYTNLETLWRTTLVRNPHCVIARDNLSDVLLRQGQVNEAMIHLRQALEDDPNDVDTHNNLGNAFIQQGLVDEAVTHYQKALEIQPDYPKAHYNLGNALLGKGRTDEAAAHFQKALAIQPDFVEAHNGLGFALLAKGRVHEAIIQFQSALDIRPDFAAAHYNLANALFQMGQRDEAIAHYRKALEIQPDNAEFHNNLGWVLLQTGRVDESIVHFQAALKSQPGIAMAHVNLAMAWLRKGRARDAVAQYQTALKLQADNVHALSDLAWVLATWPDPSVRNGAQAVELARRADRLSGGQDPVILEALAAACAEAGEFAEAVTIAQRAAQLADSQSNSPLGEALRSQIKFYQAGSPFRNPSLTNAPANLSQP